MSELTLTSKASANTPSSGKVNLYSGTDGKIHQKDAAGVDVALLRSGDALALDDADKATPVDADKFSLRDSVTGLGRLMSWVNIKAALAAWLNGGTLSSAFTNVTAANATITGSLETNGLVTTQGGVIEIGRFIDFHSGGNRDYNVRFDAGPDTGVVGGSNAVLTCGSFKSAGVIYAPVVQTGSGATLGFQLAVPFGAVRKYKVAALPVSNAGSYDHLRIFGTWGGWSSNSKYTFDLIASNRNGLTFKLNDGVFAGCAFEFWTESNGTVSIWATLLGFTTMTFSVTDSILAYVETHLDEGTPTGTLTATTETEIPNMVVSTAGNISAGNLPSPFSSAKGFELTVNPAYSGPTLIHIDGSCNAAYSSNVYFAGAFKYKVSGNTAELYLQQAGSHFWSSAVPGNAGDTAVFSQTMSLNSGGTLSVGGGFRATSYNDQGGIQVASSGEAGYSLCLSSNSSDASVGRNIFTFPGSWVKKNNALTSCGWVFGADGSGSFYKSAAGAASPVQTRLARLDDDGLRIGDQSSGAIRSIKFSSYRDVNPENIGAMIKSVSTLLGGTADRTELQFWVNNQSGSGYEPYQAMTLHPEGALLVGQAYPGWSNNNSASIEPTGYTVLNHSSAAASGFAYLHFGHGGLSVGSVSQNGTTSVSFNTTSDQRLKTNVRPANAGRFMDIQFRDFEWTDGRHDCGVIAHELQTIYPDLVTGKKGATEVRTVEIEPAKPAVLKQRLVTKAVLDDKGEEVKAAVYEAVEATPAVPAVTEEQTFPVYQQVNYIGLIGRMGTRVQQLQRAIDAQAALIAAMELRLAALEAA